MIAAVEGLPAPPSSGPRTRAPWTGRRPANGLGNAVGLARNSCGNALGDVRLIELQPAFLRAAGQHPRGWDDLWDAFIAVVRERVEEPDILRDGISVSIVPPRPYGYPKPYVVFSRKIGISGEDPDYELEAQLAITAVWTSVDVGDKIITLGARGPSTYDGDQDQPLDALVAQVSQHPAVAALRAADDQLEHWEAEYLPPEELD